MSHVLRIATLMTALAAPALAEGDAANGEKVFKKCAACHAVTADAKAKAGPNLHDVVGRKSGSMPDFKYSAPMVALGAGGQLWTPEEIALFVENPKKYLAGTKMSFAGLKKPEDRADLVAYLVSLNPTGAEPAAAVEPAPSAEPAPAVAPATQ